MAKFELSLEAISRLIAMPCSGTLKITRRTCEMTRNQRNRELLI